jgi:hypothetical protein
MFITSLLEAGEGFSVEHAYAEANSDALICIKLGRVDADQRVAPLPRPQCRHSLEGQMNEMKTDKVLLSDPALASGLWSSAMSTYSDGLQAWVAAGTAFQSEVSKFAERRILQNCTTWYELMSSRDFGGILQAHQLWSAQAAKDYSQEATQLARLLTSVTLTGATPEAQEVAQLLS